jgi:hypothetical protein
MGSWYWGNQLCRERLYNGMESFASVNIYFFEYFSDPENGG